MTGIWIRRWPWPVSSMLVENSGSFLSIDGPPSIDGKVP